MLEPWLWVVSGGTGCVGCVGWAGCSLAGGPRLTGVSVGGAETGPRPCGTPSAWCECFSDPWPRLPGTAAGPRPRLSAAVPDDVEPAWWPESWRPAWCDLSPAAPPFPPERERADPAGVADPEVA